MSTKRKAPSRIAPPVVKPSAKPATKAGIDERAADVSAAEAATSSTAPGKGEMIEISSDSGSDSEEDAEDEEMGDAQPEAETEADADSSAKKVNGDVARQEDGDAEGTESDSDVGAPSFGDLLRSHQTIDVEATLSGPADAGSNALVSQGGRSLAAPSASSLGTVLNQALRTDDAELLESCFATTDVPVVHNTIERLDSGLAGSLLVHLATRLHRRPGRAGTLMHWVRWTLVVHGGALAAQPEAMAKLASLQKVLATRARGLNSLLVLKGKLDLLESQLKLRKRVQARRVRRGAGDEGEDDEDDENVIFVDGEGEGGQNARKGDLIGDNEDVDDVLLMNGIAGDSDDEEGVEGISDDDEEGEESLGEDEVDFDDVDESMGEEDESDVEAAPPAKKPKSSRK